MLIIHEAFVFSRLYVAHRPPYPSTALIRSVKYPSPDVCHDTKHSHTPTSHGMHHHNHCQPFQSSTHEFYCPCSCGSCYPPDPPLPTIHSYLQASGLPDTGVPFKDAEGVMQSPTWARASLPFACLFLAVGVWARFRAASPRLYSSGDFGSDMPRVDCTLEVCPFLCPRGLGPVTNRTHEPPSVVSGPTLLVVSPTFVD